MNTLPAFMEVIGKKYKITITAKCYEGEFYGVLRVYDREGFPEER